MRRNLLAPALILSLLVVPATLAAQESEASDLRLDGVTLHYERTGDGPPVDLDRLMGELGIESAFVLGHSQGADVALRFALE